ncbi:hypothetical protein GCM10009120_27190 [Sphingobacterium siyangense subsp. cladoniae]|uniref:hypothetical protein n=1 Tax=Sphingobacterium siyangense TaxID=459529 RepID=UPI0031F80EDC
MKNSKKVLLGALVALGFAITANSVTGKQIDDSDGKTTKICPGSGSNCALFGLIRKGSDSGAVEITDDSDTSSPQD